MSIILSIVKSPTSQIKWSDQYEKYDQVLEIFFLILWDHYWAAYYQSEPVDYNSNSQQLIAEVHKERKEDMIGAKVVFNNIGQEDQDRDVTKAEKAVVDNQPVEKCFCSLTHDELDHGSICSDDQGTGQTLHQPHQHQPAGVITRSRENMLNIVHSQNLTLVVFKSNWKHFCEEVHVKLWQKAGGWDLKRIYSYKIRNDPTHFLSNSK